MRRSIMMSLAGVTLAVIAWPLVPSATAQKDFSGEFVAECLIVARDVDPQLADRLTDIRDQKGEAEFAKALGNARHLVHLTRIRAEDPKLYDVKVRSLQAEARARRLVEQVAEARRDSGNVQALNALEAQLDGVAHDLVALDLAARGMYVNKLQEHLNTLKEQLDEEGSNFPLTVERRKQQLDRQVELLMRDDE